jgi:dolichyl-phosphate beta-glucosyltransferase
MNKDIYLSIIIPAHNEAKRLPSTLEKILSFLKQQNYTSEVLIIENGSQDDTFRIAQHASQNLSNAQVTITAIHEEQKGKGRAVQRGMLAAQGAYRFMADADLSMPIEEISLFLPPLLNNYDVAIGSREAMEQLDTTNLSIVMGRQVY